MDTAKVTYGGGLFEGKTVTPEALRKVLRAEADLSGGGAVGGI